MRCKFREQASTAIQCQTSNLSYTLTQFRQWIAGKTRIATLVVLLGLGEGFWVTTEVMAQSARFPQATSDLASPEVSGQTQREVPRMIAQAHTKRVDLSLERQPNETYETLLLRAEAVAREAAQASFDQDTRVTDVSVMIVAQNQGAIAPVLSLEVNRSQWRSRPDLQRWVTYFASARALLQFEDVATTTADQPEPANPTTTPEQPTNGTTQPEPANPTTTPEQPTNGTTQPEPANPTTTPSQTPQPGTDLSPQPPASAPVAPASNPVTPALPNVSPGSPSTSTPTSGSQNPFAAPSTNGTTNNNPFATPTTPNNTSPPEI